MASAVQCPQCGSDNVELDPVQALTFCLDCGFVLKDAHLDISVLYDARGASGGVLVAEDDDGSRAVAVGMPKGVKRSRPTGLKHAQAKAQARTKALCGQLGLPPAVTADAVSTTEQLLAKLYERQHSCGLAGRIHNRDKTAAAAVYIAARLAQMPLTAVDVASAIRISAKAFGRAYQSAVSALGISVPTTPPDVFLHFGAQKLCKDSDAQAAVERDAVALEAWLRTQPHHRGTPLLVCAAALTIALEAGTLASGHTRKARAKDVSKLLNVSEKHLGACITTAKAKLVETSQALPWAEKISSRNVALHLQTILKLVRVAPA